ncbi:MAG: hypothetical protein AAF141_01620 [Pseudomonadota bacterium]
MTKLKTVIVAAAALSLNSGAALAACVTSSDNNNVLNVYDLPDSNSNVRGGIKVGQCSVIVTDRCEGQWCFTRTGSLLGWIDTQFLDEGPPQTTQASSNGGSGGAGSGSAPAPNEAPAQSGDLTYTVTGGGGVFNMMGVQQNTPVDPGGEVKFTLVDDNTYRMKIAPLTPDEVGLIRSDGVWTGKMESWAGQPMSISVTGFQIGAREASVKLAGRAPFGTLEMVLQLGLVSRAQNQPAAAQVPPPADNGGEQAAGDSAVRHAGACAELGRVLLYATSSADELKETIVLDAYGRAGLTNGTPVTDEKCHAALELVRREGVIGSLEEEFGPQASWQNVAPHSNRTSRDPAANSGEAPTALTPCGELEALERQARRSNSTFALDGIKRIKKENGVVPGGRVTNGRCLSAVEAIEQEGLLATLEREFGPKAQWLNPGSTQAASGSQGTPNQSNSTTPSQNSSNHLGGRSPACRNLRVELAAILRGSDEARKTTLRNALRNAGLVDVGRANVDQCLAVLAAIGSAQAQSGQPVQQGEDPKTMIEGGVEIPGSPADFAPQSSGDAPGSNANAQSAPANRQNANASGIPANTCELANEAVIKTVAGGSVPEMRRVSEWLNQYGIDTLLLADLGVCSQIYTNMQREGLIR